MSADNHRLRLKNIAWLLAPALAALILYWPGITAWFQKDDFAWLGLFPSIHSWPDLSNALFLRPAHGTLRVLSERVFFIVLYGLFGLNPLPYHLVVFATFAADTVLISLVCSRLSGRRAAGLLAASLWTINSVMAYELAWITLYNQLALGLVFLLALWLLMNGHYVAQWIVFLLGFGVLELNVVYPAIATAWALAYAPRMLKKVLPMFLGSLAFTVVHFATAPRATAGPYALHIDGSIFATLATYWKVALGPSRLFMLGIYPSFGRSAITFVLTAALLCTLLTDVSRKKWTTAFYGAWFLLIMGPLLPLRDHIQDYYLTAASIGLAMWAADGLVRARRPVSIALVAIYAVVALPLGHHITMEFHERADRIHRVLDQIVAAERAQPSTAIVLDNFDHDLYVSAFQGRPLRLYGIERVYIRPSLRRSLGPEAAEAQFDSQFGEPVGARVYDVGAMMR